MLASRPLVIGYPRTGFTLLISVISELIDFRHDRKTRCLKALCDTAGSQIAKRIEAVFIRRGIENDLIYNPNFKQLVGGPKWLTGSGFNNASFRKYIGLRGDGDFTLITTHPREVLDYYEIIHSHVSPATWPNHFDTPTGLRFASMRHPVGTLVSSCFSINALASEYIQRYVPADEDDDFLRQRLALYKLSDLKFFEALLPPYKAYLEEFVEYEQDYHLMRWEDLITNPLKTIQSIAASLGLDCSIDQARAIWSKLDHVNLTGAHKHNLRRGYGVVNGWKRWITNTHLDILRDHGLESVSRRYGYGDFPNIDENFYTPFQKKLNDLLRRGEVFREYGDEDLFGLAFNKSNIDFSRFGFKSYPWRKFTCIERSSCSNESLVMEVADVAENSCAHFNDALVSMLEGMLCEKLDKTAFDEMLAKASPLFDNEYELLNFRKVMINACQLDRETSSKYIPKSIHNLFINLIKPWRNFG